MFNLKRYNVNFFSPITLLSLAFLIFQNIIFVYSSYFLVNICLYFQLIVLFVDVLFTYFSHTSRDFLFDFARYVHLIKINANYSQITIDLQKS